MRAARTLAWVVICALGGCASAQRAQRPHSEPQTVEHAPAQGTAGDAQPKVTARPLLPVKHLKPRHKRARGAKLLPMARTLRGFLAIRGTMHRRRGKVMPDEVDHQWRNLFESLEDAAAEPVEPEREDEMLSTLMRMRMTLETEFEMDTRRYKSVSPELAGLWKDTLAGLDEQIAMMKANSSNTGFSMGESMDEDAVVTLQHPVYIVNVTSYFGRRRDPILRRQTRFHAGVDFGGAQGTLVMAAGPGVVAYADWQGGAGNHVIVVHPNGYRSHYSHLSRILVRQGMTVPAGAPLGLMGDTGRATGPHLHFAVSKHGSFVDPLDVLGVPLSRHGLAQPDS